MEIRPEKHIDIGSSLYFSAMGSAICPMEVLDHRPPIISLPDFGVGRCDLCHLDFEDDGIGLFSCTSLSISALEGMGIPLIIMVTLKPFPN